MFASGKFAMRRMLLAARTAAAAAAVVFLALAPGVEAQLASDPMQSVGVRPELLKQVGIDQKLNQSIPLDLTFHDENGKTVALGQFFGQKPVILHPRLERSVHSTPFCSMAAVLIPIDYFETFARCLRFRVRGRAFERFDQRQIAVPETKRGSKPAVDASCTLKSTIFNPKLRKV